MNAHICTPAFPFPFLSKIHTLDCSAGHMTRRFRNILLAALQSPLSETHSEGLGRASKLFKVRIPLSSAKSSRTHAWERLQCMLHSPSLQQQPPALHSYSNGTLFATTTCAPSTPHHSPMTLARKLASRRGSGRYTQNPSGRVAEVFAKTTSGTWCVCSE